MKGLALGHQTSHICAVYYLSKFLHYLNQDLGCSLSGMFMDDWYAIVDSKERAKEVLAKSIAKFAELGYELNEKTEIARLRVLDRLPLSACRGRWMESTSAHHP